MLANASANETPSLMLLVKCSFSAGYIMKEPMPIASIVAIRLICGLNGDKIIAIIAESKINNIGCPPTKLVSWSWKPIELKSENLLI